MKDELGIGKKCENCIYHFRNDIGKVLCDKELETRCKKENLIVFRPLISKLEARIKELQEQQFTEAELNTLKDILQDYFRVYTTQHYRTQPLLNKVEQTLKNLEKD